MKMILTNLSCHTFVLGLGGRRLSCLFGKYFTTAYTYFVWMSSGRCCPLRKGLTASRRGLFQIELAPHFYDVGFVP